MCIASDMLVPLQLIDDDATYSLFLEGSRSHASRVRIHVLLLRVDSSKAQERRKTIMLLHAVYPKDELVAMSHIEYGSCRG